MMANMSLKCLLKYESYIFKTMLIIISNLSRLWNTGMHAEVFEYFGNTIVSLLLIHKFNM